MSRKSLTITVQSANGHRKVVTTTGLREEVVNKMLGVAIPKMIGSFEESIQKSFYIVATFVQRVISRTPLDDNYSWIDEEGHKKKHYKDKDVARYDWYITDGSKTVMSKELIESGAMCDEIDNQNDIEIIAQYFIKTFGLKPTVLTIGNANEHAGVLEYGGGKNWPQDSLIKIDNNGREHGVKNEHSVQAPVGMLRISLAELQEGIRLNDSMISYKQPKDLMISDSQLKILVNALKSSGGIRLKDIERFIGK